ncbi:MAG: hypothetical protein EBQ96_06070 [Proteobacteria bacterium]|nr:hypothetical protein [Pseudomonadota bacterium]
MGLVIVLHDGSVGDANTLETGNAVAQAEESAGLLREAGFETRIIDYSQNGQQALLPFKGRGDVVILNLVESIDRRDDLAWQCPQWLFENGFAFTGASASALRLGDNKIVAKKLMTQNGIPTAPWHEIEALPALVATGEKWILKAACFHASLGIDEENVTTSFAALHGLAKKRKDTFGGDWFIEKYIDGREFNMGMMGRFGGEPDILPAAEMVFADEVYAGREQKIIGYKSKWDESAPEYNGASARYAFDSGDQALLASIQAICRQCWQVFGLGGYARVDFRVDPEGRPYVLEVNTNPCLAVGAGFMNANAQRGLTAVQVMEKLVLLAR